MPRDKLPNKEGQPAEQIKHGDDRKQLIEMRDRLRAVERAEQERDGRRWH
jgi:hypothetical protein